VAQFPKGACCGTYGDSGYPQRKKLSNPMKFPFGPIKLYANTIGAVLIDLVWTSKFTSSQNESAVAVTFVPKMLFWSMPIALQVMPNTPVLNRLSKAENVVTVSK
jgi:hypothetical protein